jgi:hypothetical protein
VIRRGLPIRTLLLTVGLVTVLPLASTARPEPPPTSPRVLPEAPDAEAAQRRADALLGTPETVTPTAPLTGVELDDAEAEALAERPAAIVKIPNNELAHPHTGIESADVVYEQETEGGTTRFAAVFHSQLPEVVGNVRSARPVDVALVAPYQGVFVYAGARGEVLEMIEEAALVSVGAGGPGYFIVDHRRPPHHLYTRLREAVAAREAPPPGPKPWRFDDEPPRGGRPLDGPLRVLMSPVAATTWDYDERAGRFRRLQNDRPHLVTGEGRIGAANVVLLDIRVGDRDSHGAPVYDLEGTGEALLLRDGRAFDVEWAKEADTSHLDLRPGDDDAVLKPGPTWVLLTYDGTVQDLRDGL